MGNPRHSTHQLDGLVHLKTKPAVPPTSNVDVLRSANRVADQSIGPSSSRPVSRASTADGSMSKRSPLARISSYNAPRPTHSSSSMRQSRQNQMQSSKSLSNPAAAALKKIWHAVLRECHRADPSQTGQITPEEFVAALKKADSFNTVTNEAIDRLCENYMISNGNINYLLCFRSYLNDLTNSNATLSMMSSSLVSPKKLDSDLAQSIADSHHNHPWEFDYKVNKHRDVPYWQNSNAAPKNMAAWRSLVLDRPNKLSLNSQIQYLEENKPELLALLVKLGQLLQPKWRALKNTLKRAQIKLMPGSIMLTHFINILESFEVSLRSSEVSILMREFRGKGFADVLKFDEVLLSIHRASPGFTSTTAAAGATPISSRPSTSVY